jgi:hypothetical protein
MTAARQMATVASSDAAPATQVYRQPIGYPGAWRTTDFRSPADYTIELSTEQLDDIADAVAKIRTAGLTLEDLELRHFPLPTMVGTIARIRREIADGIGFVVLRRLPVERYSKEEIGFIYWGIGTHLGRGLSQSVLGDRLGHVIDVSRTDPNARAYRNKQELSPHTDLSDLVGLCCLRTAMSGGVSQIASALTVHDVLLQERPDFLDRLYRGYTYHRRGEQRPGDLPYTPHRVPVFSNVEGKVSARYVRSYIEAGMAEVGTPIDGRDREVLDFFEAVSKRPGVLLEFVLQPGEMVLFNNYTILHARTAFEDFEDEDRRRHLLRLWLESPWLRATHPHLKLFDGEGIDAQAGKTPSYEWKHPVSRS